MSDAASLLDASVAERDKLLRRIAALERSLRFALGILSTIGMVRSDAERFREAKRVLKEHPGNQ